MINNVQVMADLVQNLVPTEESDIAHSSGQGGGNRSNIPGAIGLLASPFVSGSSSASIDKTTDSGQKKSNEDIARQLKENMKLAENQQKLALLADSVKAACEKIESQEGINNNDIKALKADLDAFGKTLENEKERRERMKERKREEERLRNQREEEEKREKERREKEKRRRNPDNWHPYILKDAPKGDRYTNTDVLCVVYAMEGSFSSLQCTNMEGQIKMADWLDIPHEEQASCPILIKSTGFSGVNLEVPMEVYVPYSISGSRHEPEIKVSIDNGPWRTPDLLTKRKVAAFPNGISCIGTTVTSFKSFRMIVVAVPKKTKYPVDKNGLNITEGCIDIQVPPGYGNDSIKIGATDVHRTNIGNRKFLGAQVHVDIDCGTKSAKDIKVKISEEKLLSQCKDRGAIHTALESFVTSGKDLLNFRLDPFLERLQEKGVVNAKEANDNRNQADIKKRTKHLLEMLIQRPSAAEKIIECLDNSGNKNISDQIRQTIPAKSGNSVVDEKWQSVLVFRGDDRKWKLFDPKITKTLQKELGCILQAGNRRFEIMSLTVSDDASGKDIADIADQFVNREVGTTLTLVCRQKVGNDQAETFVHVLPAKEASKEINRLQKHGYTRGPMELADFNIMDGETVEIYMSDNIGLECRGKKLSQGKTEKLGFKAHKDICKLNCNTYVVDKRSLDDSDDDRFRGLIHYRIRASTPLKERTDAVEVTLMKCNLIERRRKEQEEEAARQKKLEAEEARQRKKREEEMARLKKREEDEARQKKKREDEEERQRKKREEEEARQRKKREEEEARQRKKREEEEARQRKKREEEEARQRKKREEEEARERKKTRRSRGQREEKTRRRRSERKEKTRRGRG
ncbi:uncharacterized protein [Argopecten irradians]|uniref:uncharacterized protein n=1 Tax=Argopecten irradians TaxID=31199 RepID=UPI003710F59A